MRPQSSKAFFSAVLTLFVCCLACAFSQAEEPAPAVKRAPLKPPVFRQLAAGVEITILPDRQEDDTRSTHDIVEIVNAGANLKWKPKMNPTTRTLADMASGVEFRHKVWYLEFTFKPVRMMWIDVPQESGKMQRKLIWYLIYRVKNTGGHLAPKELEDGTYGTEPYDQDVRFFPQFVLQAPQFKKEYLDRLIPVAVPAIQQKEDPNRILLNSVEMGAKPIPVSTDKVDRSVWGVATWEDLDPRIDYFTIYVEGLTNAYKWTDAKGPFKKGDPPGKGRVLTQKTLVLNFWRPGDEYVEDQRGIRFGAPDIPKLKDPAGAPGKVDYTWIYR